LRGRYCAKSLHREEIMHRRNLLTIASIASMLFVFGL